jgi:SnoaL-like polyketide cyclase
MGDQSSGGQSGTDYIERLFAVWRDTPADDDEALAAFRALYTDPVRVNGVPLTAADLLARARTLGAAYEGLKLEVVDSFEAPGRVVVVHRLSGRQVGPVPTPLGDLAATGRTSEGLTIDVLVVEDGRITDVWVVADDLVRLAGLGALRLVQPS